MALGKSPKTVAATDGIDHLMKVRVLLRYAYARLS